MSIGLLLRAALMALLCPNCASNQKKLRNCMGNNSKVEHSTTE